MSQLLSGNLIVNHYYYKPCYSVLRLRAKHCTIKEKSGVSLMGEMFGTVHREWQRWGSFKSHTMSQCSVTLQTFPCNIIQCLSTCGLTCILVSLGPTRHYKATINRVHYIHCQLKQYSHSLQANWDVQLLIGINIINSEC